MKVPKLPAGEIARRAAQATESVEAAKIARAASIAAARASGIKKKQTPRPEHGQQIFVFNHLQKNHVVYSLTRAMNVYCPLFLSPFLSPFPLFNPLQLLTPSPWFSFIEQYADETLENRTTQPSLNSPSTARNPSPLPSAKTSGTPSHTSNFPPAPATSVSPPSKSCASIARDTNLNGAMTSSWTQKARRAN